MLGLILYFVLIPTGAAVVRTLRYCFWDLTTVLSIFVAIFFAFAVAYFMAMGQTDGDFSTIKSTFLTLWGALVGDYNTTSLIASDVALGSILLVLYVGLVYLIIVNIFVAVIFNAFTEVQQEVRLMQDEEALYGACLRVWF